MQYANNYNVTFKDQKQIEFMGLRDVAIDVFLAPLFFMYHLCFFKIGVVVVRLILAFVVIFMSSTVFAAGVSRNNTVEWVVVSSVQSGHTYFVQFSNALPNGDCSSGSKPRIKFDRNDDSLLSVLLTARAANLNVGFFYNETSNLPNIGGHGVSSCEILNLWIEN